MAPAEDRRRPCLLEHGRRAAHPRARGPGTAISCAFSRREVVEAPPPGGRRDDRIAREDARLHTRLGDHPLGLKAAPSARVQTVTSLQRPVISEPRRRAQAQRTPPPGWAARRSLEPPAGSHRRILERRLRSARSVSRRRVSRRSRSATRRVGRVVGEDSLCPQRWRTPPHRHRRGAASSGRQRDSRRDQVHDLADGDAEKTSAMSWPCAWVSG